MKPSRLLLGFAVWIAVVALGCSESPPPSGVSPGVEAVPVTRGDGIPCGEPLVVDLLAGQHIDVGQVTVFNDVDDLFVLIEVTGGWLLTETHVAIATSLEEIPQNGAGNPQVGHFDLSTEHDPPISSYQYHVSYDYEPGQEIFIAVHGVVVLFDEDGTPIQEETAWADGLDFPGNSWATYFTHQIAECGGGGEIIVTLPDLVCLHDPLFIGWQAGGGEAAVKIELLRSDKSLCTEIAIWGDTGSYEWGDTMPLCDGDIDPEPGTYWIRVTNLETGAYGEDSFEIPCGFDE